MTIEVFENKDESLKICWDENDPFESMMNDWTEEDFIKALMEQVDSKLNA